MSLQQGQGQRPQETFTSDQTSDCNSLSGEEEEGLTLGNVDDIGTQAEQVAA